MSVKNTKVGVRLSPAQYRALLARNLTKQESSGQERQQAMSMLDGMQEATPTPMQGIPRPPSQPSMVPSSPMDQGVQEGEELWDSMVAGGVGEELYGTMTGGGKDHFLQQMADMKTGKVDGPASSFIQQLIQLKNQPATGSLQQIGDLLAEEEAANEII